MKWTVLILLFVLFPHPLGAQVYKWVDEKGVVHFTDDVSQIPKKYKPTIEELKVSEETNPREEDQGGRSTPARSEKDRLGRGEEYWRARVEEWRKKVDSLQERLENLRERYNNLTEKFNSSKSSAERAIIRSQREEIRSQMDELRLQIGEAKEMLEKKIPEEAKLFKAKPEWTKP